MSKLKVHRFITTDELFPEANAGVLYYEKSEADKVIAHHKYKRCLAMAVACEREERRLDAIAPLFETDKECWEYGSDYWNKWHRRWLKIAEQFKEAK